MLNGLIVLLSFFLAGEFVAAWCNLPIPGSVLGMLLLFSFLLWRGSIPATVKSSSASVLPYLPLFIVPASVAILNHLNLLSRDWLALSLAIVFSLVMGIPLTGWLMQRMMGYSK